MRAASTAKLPKPAARTAPLVNLQRAPDPRVAPVVRLATTSRMLGKRAALTARLATLPRPEPLHALSHAGRASTRKPSALPATPYRCASFASWVSTSQTRIGTPASSVPLGSTRGTLDRRAASAAPLVSFQAALPPKAAQPARQANIRTRQDRPHALIALLDIKAMFTGLRSAPLSALQALSCLQVAIAAKIVLLVGINHSKARQHASCAKLVGISRWREAIRAMPVPLASTAARKAPSPAMIVMLGALQLRALLHSAQPVLRAHSRANPARATVTSALPVSTKAAAVMQAASSVQLAGTTALSGTMATAAHLVLPGGSPRLVLPRVANARMDLLRPKVWPSAPHCAPQARTCWH